MPSIQLDDDAQRLLVNYRWPGNIRQLKNITEQISIIEKNRIIDAETLKKYLPLSQVSELPILYKGEESGKFSERELLYKVLFDMKKDVNDLKQLVVSMIQNESTSVALSENTQIIKRLYKEFEDVREQESPTIVQPDARIMTEPIQESVEVEETLSLEKKEIDFIKRALSKYDGKRKDAAKELGISERTLYRKIKEYNIE
jgi:DNA-binding NtrC family response regulator